MALVYFCEMQLQYIVKRWWYCFKQPVSVILVTDAVKLREYSSVGSLPGKSSSTVSPMPSASESVVARVYLHADECHSTNQYKGIIVSTAFVPCLISDIYLVYCFLVC